MTKTTRPALQSAILGFLLTMVLITGLLTAKFIARYGADIFRDDIETSVVFKILMLALLGMIEYALPISMLVMTTIYYRSLSKQAQFRIKIKSTPLVASVFAIASFIWIAFASPYIYLHEVSLLYDIRDKEMNAPMKRTDHSFFKRSVSTSNYSEIKIIIESTYTDALNRKAAFFENVKENQMTGEVLRAYKESADYDIERSNDFMNKLRIKRAQMVSFPFIIFILFYTGMFLGILNKNNGIILLLASIYLTVLPGIYYLYIYFEKLAKEHSLSAFQSQLFYVLTLLLITVGLYFYSRRHLHENDADQSPSI